MVSTLDSESSDPSSNLGGTYKIFLFLCCYVQRRFPSSHKYTNTDEKSSKVSFVLAVPWLIRRLYLAMGGWTVCLVKRQGLNNK